MIPIKKFGVFVLLCSHMDSSSLSNTLFPFLNFFFFFSSLLSFFFSLSCFPSLFCFLFFFVRFPQYIETSTTTTTYIYICAPHIEYTPDAYRRCGFLTDFHGSAGTAVVTRLSATTWQEEKGKEAVVEEKENQQQQQQPQQHSCNKEMEMAYLWTDSRYWNEAILQLDASCWTLLKQGLPSTPSIVNWLTQTAIMHYKATCQPLKVGIDPFVHPASFAKDLTTAWTEAQRNELLLDRHDDDENDDSTKRMTTTSPVIGELVTLENNLVDAIWTGRPALPLSPFWVHPLDYAGTSLDDKVAKVREAMACGGVTAAVANGFNAQSTNNNKAPVTLAVFCILDDVAYLLNLRAKGDIDTCVQTNCVNLCVCVCLEEFEMTGLVLPVQRIVVHYFSDPELYSLFEWSLFDLVVC